MLRLMMSEPEGDKRRKMFEPPGPAPLNAQCAGIATGQKLAIVFLSKVGVNSKFVDGFGVSNFEDGHTIMHASLVADFCCELALI